MFVRSLLVLLPRALGKMVSDSRENFVGPLEINTISYS
jgi:hypothetical protein